MRVIETLPVGWTPYAVTFSHDGTRLAIGGGSWYGLGGIALIDLRTKERADFSLGKLDPKAFGRAERLDPRAAISSNPFHGGSVSGLAFTSDDRHLIATAWLSGHRRGFALALEVDGLALRPLAQHRTREQALTGLCVHGAGAVVRRWSTTVDSTLEVMQWPAEHAIDATPGRPALTNQRVVIANGRAITGSHGAHSGSAQLPPTRAGLITRPIGTAESALAATGNSHVTAIGTVAGMLIAGHATGSVEARRWHDERFVLDHIVADIPTARHDGRWVLYKPDAVVGICSLADDRGAAVTAGGTIATWLAPEPLANSPIPSFWPIPVLGTPRTIAASPDRSMVAVGIKDNRDVAARESSVALIEIEPEDVTPWRTPRTREVAITAHRDGGFDPGALGVLADALEEVGCAPRVLHHLRTHDRRLRTCWVVDQLCDETVLPSP